MKPIILHPVIFYFLLFFIIAFMGSFCWIFWIWAKQFFYDVIIFIDKSNRFKIIRDKLSDTSTYTYNEKTYMLVDDCSILNKRGKSMFVFSVGKPNPLKLDYNTSSWVSSDSMMSIINNKLIQKLVQTSSKFTDSLILFGAIGGMIAGISSIVIMLKQFGVI